MRIEDIKLDFDDVLIRPKRSELSSRKDVDIKREYSFKHSHFYYSGVPIIAANMDSVGTIEMSKAFYKHEMMVALHKYYNLEEIYEHLQIDDKEDYAVYNTGVWYSMGISEQDYEKFVKYEKMVHPGSDIKICIDVANGYQESFVEFIIKIRNEYPKITIMAGNVVTADITESLIMAGADIVKIGIGPGSVCTTRTKTGVGYPQLSAIIECADAAHGLGGHICADGGCRTPGDVAKAFGAGADFVMLGGMLAGHDECEGEKIYGASVFNTIHNPHQEVTHMKFYGMSSTEAQEKHGEGLKEYRASEGKCVEVPYKGPVENIIQEILGGLRSTCTYVGARELKELTKRTTFVRVNRQKNNIYGRD